MDDEIAEDRKAQEQDHPHYRFVKDTLEQVGDYFAAAMQHIGNRIEPVSYDGPNAIGKVDVFTEYGAYVCTVTFDHSRISERAGATARIATGMNPRTRDRIGLLTPEEAQQVLQLLTWITKERSVEVLIHRAIADVEEMERDGRWLPNDR